ncbi:MAG: TapY2 family type IVa secretion system protein [Psychrosphaera sp.]|nr:TapY2 family type IVa secretion system protein [Psychrosphaera sp.]
MKNTVLIVMASLLSMLLSTSSLAANDRSKERSTQYKCHFELAGGKEVVNYFMSKDNYAKQLQRVMVGQTIFAKNGVTRLHIIRVGECVKADAVFMSAKALELDKVTLS